MATPDETLVLRTLSGDQQAFADLYDKYARLVRAVCYDSTKDINTAQDLAQDIFMRAYNKLENLKEPDRFGPWLISIARNVGREYRRGQARDRHQLVGFDVPEMLINETDSDEYRMELLQKAIDSLDDKERMALNVHYLQAENINEALKIMDMSRSSYYRLIDEIKNKVAKMIEKEEAGKGNIDDKFGK